MDPHPVSQLTSLPHRSIKGNDGEARIRVKFSAAAATASWFGATTAAINVQIQKAQSGRGKGDEERPSESFCEVPISPPLPLSTLACVRWARSMPSAAAAALEGCQHPHRTAVPLGINHRGGIDHVRGRDDVEVFVPMVLIVLRPEELIERVGQ